jgi:hypothetical protein
MRYLFHILLPLATGAVLNACAPSPDVTTLRGNLIALCDRYVECGLEGAEEERDSCVSGANEEMDRVAGLTGDDCQRYVDVKNDYYVCLNAAECTAYTDDAPVCTSESAALGEFVASSGFDCDGAE